MEHRIRKLIIKNINSSKELFGKIISKFISILVLIMKTKSEIESYLSTHWIATSTQDMRISNLTLKGTFYLMPELNLSGI